MESTQIGKWKYLKSKFIYEKKILVRQTNFFGNTYFANYIDWQGEARENFFLEHPDAVTFLKENYNLKMVTHSLYHRFLENTYFGDRVRIEITSSEILKYSFFLIFSYFNLVNNNPVGQGWQKIGFYDGKNQSLCAIPKIFLDLLEPVMTDQKIQNIK